MASGTTSGFVFEPKKPEKGYRQYPVAAIARIHFIKRAQQSGFKLKEIAVLLSLDSGHCDDVRNLAEQKRQEIDSQIRDLTALRHALDILVKGCQTDPSPEQHVIDPIIRCSF